MASNHQTQTRADGNPAYQWNLRQLFANDAAVMAAFAEASALLPDFAQFNGQIGSSAERLFAYLQFSEAVMHKAEKLALYTFLLKAQDAGNEHAVALYKKAETLAKDIGDVSAFATVELTNIDEARLEAFIAVEPGLEIYRHFFKNLALDRPHIRSEEVERLLAQSLTVLSAPSALFRATTQLVMPPFMPQVPVGFQGDEPTEWLQVSDDNFLVLLQSRDRRTRKLAFEGIMGTYGQFAPALAANYIAGVEGQIFTARARGFKSVLEMKLSDPRLPVSVYDSLIATARANLQLLQRYLELRRQLLGVDKLGMYDLYVPLIAGFDKEVSFDEAKRTAIQALMPLGAGYVARLFAMYDSGRVDVMPNEGKEAGAFSASQWGYPGYIMLNFRGLLRDVFTIAHEGGHHMHSDEANGTQPFVYREYPTFCAETASTVNEQLVAHHLITNATSSEMRLHLLNQALENFRGAVIRQAMFAEFERRVFKLAEGEGCEKQELTLDLLCDLYLEIVTDYYGPSVEIDECVKYEWLKIPHFVNTPFYVYTYATGMSAAIGLARNIIKIGEPAVQRYFGFLRAGRSQFPLDSLREAGIDMSTPQPIQLAFDNFAETLDLVEAELALSQH
jgi:oligoendopeptidase F